MFTIKVMTVEEFLSTPPWVKEGVKDDMLSTAFEFMLFHLEEGQVAHVRLSIDDLEAFYDNITDNEMWNYPVSEIFHAQEACDGRIVLVTDGTHARIFEIPKGDELE